MDDYPRITLDGLAMVEATCYEMMNTTKEAYENKGPKIINSLTFIKTLRSKFQVIENISKILIAKPTQKKGGKKKKQNENEKFVFNPLTQRTQLHPMVFAKVNEYTSFKDMVHSVANEEFEIDINLFLQLILEFMMTLSIMEKTE